MHTRTHAHTHTPTHAYTHAHKHARTHARRQAAHNAQLDRNGRATHLQATRNESLADTWHLHIARCRKVQFAISPMPVSGAIRPNLPSTA
eukprot:9351423-Alexandrium_andersonii.AAC.1